MKKGTKFYVILGYNTETETWYGYVENSFSMGADKNRIRTFSTCRADYPWKDRSFPERKRIAKAYLKKHGYRCNYARDYIIDAKMNPNSPNQWIYFYLRDIADNLNKKHYNNCHWKVYRVNSKFCPINVNMNEYYKTLVNKKFRKSLDKFQLRNQEFSVKEVSKD